MIPPTVLNVDDSEDDVVMLQAACESVKVSFRFQSVEGGESAILYLQGAQPYSDRDCFPFPNLLLLDLKMPGKSGFDVLEWLRAQAPPLQQLPIIVFTASVHDEDAVRAFQLGADAYLVKPSDFNDLRRMVITIDAALSRSEIDFAELRNLQDARLSAQQLQASGSKAF
jgi:CheY-like chemotaxis protein